jgi:hypothetical protein
MRIFKDKLYVWIEEQIQNTMSLSRKRAFQEVKAKLDEIIKEEFSKMKEIKDA